MERFKVQQPSKNPIQFVCDYRTASAEKTVTSSQHAQPPCSQPEHRFEPESSPRSQPEQRLQPEPSTCTQPEQIVESDSQSQSLPIPLPEQLSEPIEEFVPTIRVTLDDIGLLKAEQELPEQICQEPDELLHDQEEVTDKQDEIEGVPLWKRNNCPSRLFYPQKPELIGQNQSEYEGIEEKALSIRPFRLLSGVFVLMAAFTGVVCFCMFGGVSVVPDSAQYSTFLAPVMMQNPTPFSSISQADNDMILQASVWRAVTLNNSKYQEIDDQGRLVVPGEDIEKACTELFGNTCRLAVKESTNKTFFTYDSASNTYRVLPQSSVTETASKIKSIQKENGAVIVMVEVESAEKKQTSLLRYVIEVDALSGKPYLASIEQV